MNTGLSSRLHPRKSSFVLSWSSASATRTMKAQDTKRAFKPNFPNFPAIRPKEKFFEPRQISYQNAPNSTYISKTIGSSRKYKHPCVTRNCAFSLPDSPEIARIFCKQTRSGIIPTRKANPHIFLIALKQDYADAQYAYSVTFFHFLLLRNKGKMFKNLTISKESTLLDLLLNVTLICCAS